MENTLPQTGIIRALGMMAGPVRADLPIAMIATRDIGAFAAQQLASLQFSGKQTRELLGQRDITYSEAARIIGAAIGKPNLTYVQLPAEQAIQGLYDTLPIIRTFPRESRLFALVIRSKVNRSLFFGPSIVTADCISF